jgi:TonB family protein
MILPPQAPGSVAGRTYRVRFWVGADGRVTRVDVDPPIGDDAYRREFLKRMLAYQFVPAQTKRDRRNVASVYTVTLRPGH